VSPIGDYPQTVDEVLDDSIRFRRPTVRAALRFKASRPWRGSLAERKTKFRKVHEDLCQVYGKQTTLVFGRIDGSCSGHSCYNPASDTITLHGRLSVVTYLHEVAHALGRDERGACRWSINLFAKCFPREFLRCQTRGHMLMARRSHDKRSRSGSGAR